MYNEEYENEQNVKSNDNFIVNFYYNNKVLIWILVGVIAFILIMSLLTRGGSESSAGKNYNVSILPENEIEISIGNSYPLKARVDKNSNAIIVWSSADESIATVDNGTVTAVDYGKTTITATYIHNDDTKYTATKEVTVADGNPNLRLTDVSFKNGDLLMPVNSTYDIFLSLTPSNGYVSDKSFTSSNPNVVTVDNKGHVVSVGEGEAIISLSVNNGTFRKTLKVFVNRDYTTSEIVINPSKISFDSELVKMKVGMSQKLRYTLFPVDADSTKLDWTSSDEGIVKIDENGYAKALKEGVVTITLRSITGVNDTMDVEVESDIVPVTDINLSLSDLYLTVGQSQTITPTVSPANASNKSLSYLTSNTNVIAVSPNPTGTSATIYAISEGNTTLTISSVNNVERRLNVVVTSGSSGNEGSSGGSSGGSDSSSSQGFKISSRDANGKGFIVKSYNDTLNNTATGPVEVTIQKTSSSIAKFRVAKCFYNDSSCDPSTYSDVEEFTDSVIFNLNTTGTYVLRIAKYNSNDTLIGMVDKYIAVNGSGSGSGRVSITCNKTFIKIGESTKCTANLSSGDSVKEWKNITNNVVSSNKTNSITLTGSKVGSTTWRVTTNKGATASVTITVTNTSTPTVSITCDKTSIKVGESAKCTANLSSGDSVKEWKNITDNIVSSNKTNSITLTGSKVGSTTWRVTTNKGATASVTITVTAGGSTASKVTYSWGVKNELKNGDKTLITQSVTFKSTVKKIVKVVYCVTNDSDCSIGSSAKSYMYQKFLGMDYASGHANNTYYIDDHPRDKGVISWSDKTATIKFVFTKGQSIRARVFLEGENEGYNVPVHKFN